MPCLYKKGKKNHKIWSGSVKAILKIEAYLWWKWCLKFAHQCIFFCFEQCTGLEYQPRLIQSNCKQVLRLFLLYNVTTITHCYLNRLNPKRKCLFQFCLPALLEIHWNWKKKLKSSEEFLRAALIGHGDPGPFWKIAKMQNDFIKVRWKCSLSILSKNMSQAPSKCLFERIFWVDWIISRIPSWISKFFVCFGFLWISSYAER